MSIIVTNQHPTYLFNPIVLNDEDNILEIQYQDYIGNTQLVNINDNLDEIRSKIKLLQGTRKAPTKKKVAKKKKITKQRTTKNANKS
jgi:hypothetical protein